ncbi:MAG: MBL fold metallo-hydrolase [archaeon]
MKLTKLAQSCVLIETKEKRILVDPGSIMFEESLMETFWKNIDVLLITHRHSDHIHLESVKKISTNPKTKFYTTNEVATTYPSLKPEIVKEGDVLELHDIKVEVVKSVHGWQPMMKGGGEIYEEVGYIVDDGKKRAYFPGDTLVFPNDYKCDVLFLPANNHGVCMGPFEAALWAKDIGPELVIPYHNNNEMLPMNENRVKQELIKNGLSFRFLKVKESIEV